MKPDLSDRYLALYITPGAKALCGELKKQYRDRLDLKRLNPGALYKTFAAAMNYKAVIAVMAAGIVVRGIAPFLKDKTKDPAVIVIDEKGKFAVSMLSGHVGGANHITREIAGIIGAQAVITTASDLNNVPALDLYSKNNGYFVEDKKLYAKFAMALLQNEKIGVFVEKGEPSDFFSAPWFELFRSEKKFRAFSGKKIAVTWRNISGRDPGDFPDPASCPSEPVLYLAPKRLVVGIGFHRGMDGAEMIDFVKSVFGKKMLRLNAVKKIATIDKRRNEPALESLSIKLGAEPAFYEKKQLDEVGGLQQSRIVEKYHGVGNVSEACAYLCSNKGRIIVPKQKRGNITVCVALEKYS